MADVGRALDDVLRDRLQRFSDTVRESQAIIAEINSLVENPRAVAAASKTAESGDADTKRRVLNLLEVLRRRIVQIETRGAAKWFDS